MTIKRNGKRCQWTWTSLHVHFMFFISAAAFLMSWNTYFSVRPNGSQTWSKRWVFSFVHFFTHLKLTCAARSAGKPAAGGQATRDGKTTSERLVFSFSVWKQCTIQGSSISEERHCLRWQPAQSCAAISLLSTAALANLVWPGSRLQGLPCWGYDSNLLPVLPPVTLCQWNCSFIAGSWRKTLSFWHSRIKDLTFVKKCSTSPKSCPEQGWAFFLLHCAACEVCIVLQSCTVAYFSEGFCTTLKLTWPQPCVSCSTERSFIWKWWLACGLPNLWTHWFIFFLLVLWDQDGAEV